MEEGKEVKKNNKPIILIALAVLFILAGGVLLATGNNKSFLAKDDPQPQEDKKEDNTEIDVNIDDQNRNIIPISLTEEEVRELINTKKEAEYSEEAWTVDSISIVAHDEKYEKFLVTYGEVQEDETVITKQTIVSVLNNEKNIELPGWIEGERDLTVYNFVYDTTTDEPVEVEEPTEPTEVEEPIEQPTEPVEVEEPAEQPTETVEVTEPTEPTEPETNE